MTDWLEANGLYECPLCLGVYLLNENRHGVRTAEQGEFQVKARIDPGEQQTRHYPGSPASVERIESVMPVTECSHSDCEAVHEEVARQFEQEFAEGYIEPNIREEPYV